MDRLSSPLANLKDHYDAIVVGSGYGGGVAASRLARAGRKVCLLERGREIVPGEYPDTTVAATTEMQVDSDLGHVGSRTGLFDMRLNDDINVVLGCGLGGTSLINASVSLKPDPRVFEDPDWPQSVRDDVAGALEEGFARAAEMLKPTPYPEHFPTLPKLEAMQQIAEGLITNGSAPAAVFSRPPINMTFESGVNHVGVHQNATNGNGDCVTGSNDGAKNTTLMNYLPDARNFGAEIYTQAAVRRIEEQGDRWLVHFQPLNMEREVFDAPTMAVSADLVVLAAGTLGTTEILLRSTAHGLPLSDRLGERFTGNGDVLAFAYNCDREIRAVGYGAHPPEEMDFVGPCITGLIDVRGTPDLKDGMVIEEGVLPGALASMLPATFAAGSKLIGFDTDVGDTREEIGREVESLTRGAYRGAVRNTMTFLVMAHDDANGRITLEDDRVRVRWPDVGRQSVFEAIEARLRQATEVLGGTYINNPVWTDLFDQRLVTVHPLGGCAMGDDAGHGVVDGFGRVFSGPNGTAVHDGLYVFDGSIIPRSLGVNPLFTITALAERGLAHMAGERGWTIDYSLPSRPPAPKPKRLGIQFTETMRGFFSTREKDDYERGYEHGRNAGSPFEFTLSVISDDLDRMLESGEHAARMIGTASAPALSPEPLTATEGHFNLFVRDPADPDARQMRYRMRLNAADGRAYYFVGFKRIKDDWGPDVWSDTTTLFITVHDGDSDAAPVLGRGILKIRPDDFARQMTTLEVRNAETVAERIAATSRFGRFFAGALFDVYGPNL